MHPRVQRAASKVFRFGIVPRAKASAGEQLMRRRAARGGGPEIRTATGERAEVDEYWTGHTVNSTPFFTARQSRAYLDWRFREYPLFREFSGLYGGPRTGETVLDYGCGPGNDVAGFALHTQAARVIGMDVSPRALGLARDRLTLHPEAVGRVELVRLSDDEHRIPLEDASVDFVSSQGVLHHTSDPPALLAELHRVLKPGGEGSIMVYHRDSVWMHLYVAWELLVRDGRWPGETAAEVFHRTTDGDDCPIAECYTGTEFVAMLETAGFEARFMGGYLSQWELRAMTESWGYAIADERLGQEHRDFLRELRYDYHHRPMTGSFHAGIGGTYRIRKQA